MKAITATLALTTATTFCAGLGCIKASSIEGSRSPFEVESLDACLVIVLDRSSSFDSVWEKRAFGLFQDLMERYFIEGKAANSKIIISQISGSDQIVLFEGRPQDLKSRFPTPGDFNEFLAVHADPRRSHVYESTRATLDYVQAIPGISPKTRTMTVICSDLLESNSDVRASERSREAMLDSLSRYRQLGGALALYYVSQDESIRWNMWLQEAGFEPGMYVIENTLVEHPQLPSFR